MTKHDDLVHEKKRCAGCGKLVEPHVRFHWLSSDEGHYTDGHEPEPSKLLTMEEARARGATGLSDTLAESDAAMEFELELERPKSGGKRSNKRPADLSWLEDMWADDDIQRAPRPGDPPLPALWGKEADLRRDALRAMRALGYSTHDLEQGYRTERGGSRQSPGIGDAYFQGHGVRGWIEFKRWDNTPSADQINFAKLELSNGGIYLLVYSTGQLRAWHSRHQPTERTS